MAKRLLEGPSETKGSALKGNLQVDSVRGVLRVRAWPRKRGPPKSAAVKAQNIWFRDCLDLIKKIEPGFLLWCMERTKRTNIYPRDLAMQLLSGRGICFLREDGRRIFPEVFMKDVSLSLDSIGQIQGQLLYRGVDYWTPLQPTPAAGQVLGYDPLSGAPFWTNQTPAAPTWHLVDRHIVSGAVANYDINVSAYDELAVMFYDLTASANGIRWLRVSTDNGLTFWNTNGDYRIIGGGGVGALATSIPMHDNSSNLARGGSAIFRAIRANAAGKFVTTSNYLGNGTTLLDKSALPITHLRAMTSAGNLTGGTIVVYGR